MAHIDAEFVLGVGRFDQCPTDGRPEIALCGRSNVGKSSLINRMLGRKNLARTSAQPGKTRELNYYAVQREDKSFYLVDFPGYGFARVSQGERKSWQKLAQQFLEEREPLRLMVQIVDIRHAPSKEDIGMFYTLQDLQRPTLVVATKADKIAKGKHKAHLQKIARALGMPWDAILPFSSETGLSKEDLWATWLDFI